MEQGKAGNVARKHTMAVKKAIEAKDWALAEEIIMEDMRGAHGRNWLRRLAKLIEASQEQSPVKCPGCGIIVRPGQGPKYSADA